MYLLSYVLLHFWLFLVDKWVFFMNNLGFLEITEWEPCLVQWWRTFHRPSAATLKSLMYSEVPTQQINRNEQLRFWARKTTNALTSFVLKEIYNNIPSNNFST